MMIGKNLQPNHQTAPPIPIASASRAHILYTIADIVTIHLRSSDKDQLRRNFAPLIPAWDMRLREIILAIYLP